MYHSIYLHKSKKSMIKICNLYTFLYDMLVFRGKELFLDIFIYIYCNDKRRYSTKSSK